MKKAVYRSTDKLYKVSKRKPKKLLLILMMITIFTTGCNKLSESEDFVQGQEKLESHQYNEALTLLSQVLNEDPDNSSARSMYMQARKMQSAQEYENNQDYIRAIRELETIVNINDGSKQIKREAINKKAELEKLQDQKEQEAIRRKENAKKVSKEENSKRKNNTSNTNKEKEDKKQNQLQVSENKKEEIKKPIKEEIKEEVKEEIKEPIKEENKEPIKEPVINQQETTTTEEKVNANVENKVETKNIEESN